MDEDTKAPEKAPKEIRIRVVVTGQNNSIVEPIDLPLERISVRNKDIKDWLISESVFERGIRYGIPFETLDFPQPTAQEIGQIFRSHGIWTPEDIRTKPAEVTSALQALAGKYYRVLLEYIKNK